MLVRQILRSKGSGDVLTIRPDATVAEAARLLSQRRIGCLVVSRDGARPEGVLSERDIVHALLEKGPALMQTPVSQLMTRCPVTCAPTDSLRHALQLMEDHHIRHLPVLDDGHLIGVVSARDFTRLQLEELGSTADRPAPHQPSAYAH